MGSSMVTRSEWLHGFWAYYRRYTDTTAHTATTAALAIFGLLVFVDPWFAAAAIASYVVPPVVLYTLSDEPVSDESAGEREGEGEEEERRETLEEPPSTHADRPVESATTESETSSLGGAGVSRTSTDGSTGNRDTDSDSDDGDTDFDGVGTDTDSDADGTDTDSDADGTDTDSDSDGTDTDSDSDGTDTDSDSDGTDTDFDGIGTDTDSDSDDGDTDSDSDG